MSALSDEYIKNFSKERKAIFNKRFSDDYDPNESEEINIIRILNEMRELGLAEGGITRIGLKNGMKLSDFFNIQASGSKSGKQQIEGAPEGFTIDKETFNAILKADIPLSEKIDFLASYQYGKGRDRIEKDDQELFLGEGGFKDRNIGLGFNKEGEGFGGTLMYNLETGKPEFKIGFKKQFNKGGRVAYQKGSGYEPFAKTTLDINPNQTVEIPSRIKSDFDKKTSQAYDIGSFIGQQNLEPNQLGIVQAYAEDPSVFSKFDRGLFSLSLGQGVAPEPFEKQGYASDIRHGLGSSALKDQVIDFLGSNLNLDKSGKLLDLIGSGVVNVGSLFEEGKDILSSAKDYAERYPGLTGIQDYDYMPNTKYLTQPIEDIVANYIGSKVPFNMNIRDKLSFLTNYKKYGKQTLDQIKNIKEKRMQDRIKAAEAKQKENLRRQKIAKTPGAMTSGGGREVSTDAGAVAGAQQDISNYQSFNEVPLKKGGLARMLGE